MGQYYTALVIDGANKVKKLSPSRFDVGVKLLNQAWIGKGFVNAVYSLIHHNPCKVAWVGDYAKAPYEPERHAFARAMPHKEFMKMYEIAWGNAASMREKDFSLKQLALVGYGTKGTYLVNHDLKCYIDMAAYIKRSSVRRGEMKGYSLDPLPLLTACGNGRGFGDYEGRSCYEDVGTWAFHRLEYTDQIPEGYSKKTYRFVDI